MQRKSNKRIVYALTLSCLFVLAGCNAASSMAQLSPLSNPNIEGGDRTLLLNDYPIKDVPLYKCKKVTCCSFMLNQYVDEFTPENDDEYSVYYDTAATPEDVLTFYNGLLTVQDYSREDAVGGSIGDIPVGVFAGDFDKDGTVEVLLRVSTSIDADTNPYFTDYPGLINILGSDKNTLVYQEYRQFYGDDSGILFKNYTSYYYTDLTPEEFSGSYEDEYGDEDGFSKSETETQLNYQFIQNGYTHIVFMDKPDSYIIPAITIACRTE